MFFNRLLIGICVVGFTACVSTLYMPTLLDAEQHKISLDSLRLGREMVMNKCGGCHNLYLPSTHTNQEWKTILDNHQQSAVINEEEKKAIFNYIKLNTKK